MPEEAIAIEPKTDSLEIKAKLTGSFEEMYKRLYGLQLFIVEKPQNSLKILEIESRDMQKRPFLFFIIELEQERATVNYTIAPDSSPKLRRLFVLKTLTSVLSLVADVYTVDNTALFQSLDSAIDDVLNSITQGYSTLFNNYDSLSNEYRELKRLNIELAASNKSLAVEALQLSDQNKSMAERLKVLETYSDSSLMVMIQEWLDSHDDAIDVNEFAKSYKMNPTRVEQILNKMVTLGYIELKG
ncbi:MAG: hypothetical protein ABSE71_04240 [Candidatus Micrarchaeaceae archaeon]|jgi:hypothetical protein|nr:hypothetical protein [Candidatus Micrarchaeota archaeon]HII10073.1 hypothetical protein [Candidatus Micrarchaeota archaeon]